MSLKLEEVNDEDRGLLSPCGILCLGCDTHLGEGIEAAKKLVDIWEGFIAGGELDTFIQPDGVHPSETGLVLISEILSIALESVDLAGKE